MIECKTLGRVAQLAEQWPFKPLVESSSLSALICIGLPQRVFSVLSPPTNGRH
jgi:hypothetical protein